jgi:uncharacterized protein YggE
MAVKPGANATNPPEETPMTDARQLVTTAAVAVLAIAGYQALHDTSRAPAAPASHAASGVLQPYMRFTGSGDVTMRPDRGTISFSTHGTGATLAAAQDAASDTMRALIRKLRADGVARSDMRTDGISGGARPRYGDFDAAIRAAIADARSKADAAAAAAGLHVSGVVSVDESRGQPYYGAQAAYSRLDAAPSTVPVKRGTQQVSAQVTVVFAYAG